MNALARRLLAGSATFALLAFAPPAAAQPSCVSSPLTYTGYIEQTDDRLNLTWGESYYLMAYVAEYEASHDERFLHEMVAHIDEAFKQRNDVRFRALSDQTDFPRKQPVWTSMERVIVPYAAVVASGMIGYPIARFVELVRQAPAAVRAQPYCDPRTGTIDPGRTLSAIATGYLVKLQQTVRAHDHEWNPAASGYRARDYTRSFLLDSRGREIAGFKELPYNMSHAMGRLLATLYRVTHEPAYLVKVTAMAHHFKTSLIPQGDAYRWWYWQPDPRVWEDISHGAISIDFARLCYESGIVFSFDDMRRFANTLVHNMDLGDSNVAVKVNGGGGAAADSDRHSVALWLPLSTFNTAVKELVNRIYSADPRLYGTVADLGYALLKQYGGGQAYGTPCSEDNQCLSNQCFNGQVCGNPLGNTSNCTRSAECVSHSCVSNVCREHAAPALPSPRGLPYGTSCARDTYCASGICFAGKVCGELLGETSTCTRGSECVTGLCRQGTCIAFTPPPRAFTKNYGNPCRNDYECRSKICYAFAVCGDPLGPGSTCNRAHECSSDKCNDNVCE